MGPSLFGYDYCGQEKCTVLIEKLAAGTTKHKNAVIAVKEVAETQKKKLRDYRDLISKTQLENYDLEDEVKQKEESIVNLKIQLKESEEILEKVDKKTKELTKEIRFLKNKIDLKNLDLLEADKVLIKHKEISNKVIDALKEEIKDLKSAVEQIKETSETESKEVQTEEVILKDQNVIKTEMENKSLLKKVADMDDEIDWKTKKIEELEAELLNKSLRISQNSLKDELEQVFINTCSKCGKIFQSENDLQNHIDNVHVKTEARTILLTKMRKLEADLIIQRNEMTSSLLRLRQKEILDNERCRCVGFCHINHRKHNFYKSKVNDILVKIKENNETLNVAKEKSKRKKKKKIIIDNKEKQNPKMNIKSKVLGKDPTYKANKKVNPRKQSTKTLKTCGRRENFSNVAENVIDDAPHINDEYEEDSTNGDDIDEAEAFLSSLSSSSSPYTPYSSEEDESSGVGEV